MRQLCLAAPVLGLLAACGPEVAPACVTVDVNCAPLYRPDFDNIYNMTLRDTCGSDDVSCHSAAGKQGGMSFADQQRAYEDLLDGRVVPGNPGCSKMIVRTDSPGADYQMPPGDPIGEAERCALILWVMDGALPGPSQLPFGATTNHGSRR